MIYPLTALLAFASSAAAACNADNCLRALRATQTPGRLQAAQSFCSTFKTTSIPSEAIPTYVAKACIANQVGSPAFRISSACDCIITTTTTSVATTTITPSPTTPLQACGVVSSLSSAFKVLSPSATPTIPARIAHDCLNSVPLHKTEALDFLDSVKPYLEWQSDTAYLKSPPAGQYFYPPHDVFGKFASIRSKLVADLYINEYDFQQDLYQIFAPAHDGHFILYPDLLTKAFGWGRKVPLVSLSQDGIEIPKIYAYYDVLNSNLSASELVSINGIDASKYIEDYVGTAGISQDVDANYNSMFYGKASEASGAGLGFFFKYGRVRYIYPGVNTTFIYANGTVRVEENIAEVKPGFEGVTDGPSFYAKFCTPPKSSSVAATNSVSSTPAGGIPTYPIPVFASSGNVLSGYYLEGKGVEHVAVLAVLNFEPDDPVEFQSAAQNFFAKAKADGKTKLVIDLGANGGGYIFLGYDLYRQLFPDIVQKDYNRIRENPTFLAMARVLSDAIPKDFDPYTSGDEDLISAWETPFNYRFDLNITSQPFLTFEDKFGPYFWAGDKYTNLMRWNLNDSLLTSNASWGLGTDVTGYGSRTNLTQPFAAEDIIMLYDGACASTCTLFSEFMRLSAGVKSVAFGGRPNTNVIQGVGGVKGGQVLTYSDIKGYKDFAVNLTKDSGLIDTLSVLTDLPINRSVVGAINLRDQILPDNVKDGIPAQFVYEPADCRLYYTPPMITDVAAQWKAAANAAWNGARCVSGAGLRKRSDKKATPKMSPLEVREDAILRKLFVERLALEKEKGNNLFEAKFGRKVIQ